MSLRIRPLTLDEANLYIDRFHRHHKPVESHRFSLAAYDGDSLLSTNLMGVAICGRPVARGCNHHTTLEVTRLCTQGNKNVCSFLYGAYARVAREMGFNRIQTYILLTESGVSLRASGWEFEAITRGGDWNNSTANMGTRRTDQPMTPKQRWARVLR